MTVPSPKEDGVRRFISAEIRMLETAEGGDPVRFLHAGREYRVAEIQSRWQDYGFSPAAIKRNWRNRRHRNYYEVLTEDGEHFLLYFDRGVKPESPRKWILLEKFEPRAGSASAIP